MWDESLYEGNVPFGWGDSTGEVHAWFGWIALGVGAHSSGHSECFLTQAQLEQCEDSESWECNALFWMNYGGTAEARRY